MASLSLFVRSMFLSAALLYALVEAQRTCIPGTFVSGDDCLPCPKQRVSMIANATECTRCLDGTIPARSRNRCIPCPSGRFFTIGSLSPCRRCPINTYSSEPGSLRCTACPKGTISTIESKRLEDCVSCPIGTNAFRSESLKRIRCNSCPAGMSTFSTNAPTCLPCPKGQARFLPRFNRLFRLDPPFAQRFNTLDFLCRQCSAGTFADEKGLSKCKKCPVGTYQDEPGATSCKECPPNSEAAGIGAKECRPTCNGSTPGCISCNSGTQFNAVTEKCEPCPAGTISTIRSATKCFPCPMGEGGVNDKRTRCVCDATSRLRKNGKCEDCPSNFVALNGNVCTCGIDGANDDCECPARTKRIGNTCEACNPSSDLECERCEVGEFTMMANGINVCERCPQDTFNNKEDSDSCKACPAGKSSNTFDDGAQCQCNAGLGLRKGQCKPCPPGTYSPRAENKCIKCFSGSFNDKPGASRCKNCRAAEKRGAVSCDA